MNKLRRCAVVAEGKASARWWSVWQRASGYNLNAQDLSALAACGLDEGCIEALRVLEGRRFNSKKSFLAGVHEILSTNGSPERERHILAHARRLSLRKVRRYVRSLVNNNFASSPLAPTLGTALRLRPVPFALWFRIRALMVRLLRGLRGRPYVDSATNTNEAGFEYNYNQLLSFLPGHRNRTERLINVLRTIQDLDPARARVLCVGPRNEAEVLLLPLYGFRARNIEAIDLFSYSPRIRLVDMNDLDYPDNHFDVYYSSAVIKYSPDIRHTVDEAIRVTRRGGFMAFGFTFGTPSNLVPQGSDLLGGLKDLLALFDPYVGHVYWSEEYFYAPGDTRATVIFRLDKFDIGDERIGGSS